MLILRRWSLKQIFLAIAIVAVILASLGIQRRLVFERRDAVKVIRQVGGRTCVQRSFFQRQLEWMLCPELLGMAPTHTSNTVDFGTLGELDDDRFRRVGQAMARLKIEELTLPRRSNITDESVAIVAAIPGLRALDAADSYISDSFIAGLADLSELSHLDVSGSLVTASSIPILTRMQQLKSLTLPIADFDHGSMEYLRTQLPACTVSWRP